MCNFFLIHQSRQRDNILMHDISDNLIRLAKQQISKRYCTKQSSSAVKHITNIDGLTIHAHITDTLDSLLHCQILF